MDYTTVKGIQQRTGVEKKNLIAFLLKELLDNALDFLETHGHGRGIEPIVKVIVTQEKIIVSNSNFGLESFTKDRIKSIFTFDKFYSSKRNIYRVSRGHLGDALKSVICIPYALATENGIQGWNEPLVMTDGSNKSFLIRLILDRLKQTINTKIEIQPKLTSTNGFTSVEVNFPVHENHSQLRTYLRDYARLNPHITFDFDIYPDLDEENTARERYFLPQTQKLSQWSNRPSIHYYSLPEFQQLIYGIEDNNTIAYDVIRLFREATNISRNDTKMTIGQLKHDGEKIIELYSKLRDIFHTRIKLETQFDTNKKIRQEAIKNRVEQFGYKVSNIKYRLVHAAVDGDGDSDAKFPFIFEITILHTSNASTSYVVNGINSSARYDNPFQGKYTNTYEWSTSGGKKQQQATAVDEILAKYGYSNTKQKSKKTPSIIIVNLISPRINYEGYNKRIDLTPFANTIADATYKLASASVSITVANCKKMTGKDVVEEILRERLDRVNEDPELKHSDKWTQSTVYYKTRKRMLDYEIPLTERETITRQIKEICEQKWNKRREELGIFAADRAQMYFRGKIHDVGIDELRDLKQRGTDLVIIEKEGVCEVLSPFAEKYGIALLNTRGFLTDYAKELSELSEFKKTIP